MAGLICLTIAGVCAVIARVLLLIAALNISVWWALGVFLPFGPTMFRLAYPEAARSSFIFRIGTLGCVLLYVVLGPGAMIGPAKNAVFGVKGSEQGYASEFENESVDVSSHSRKLGPQTLAERRAANEREFQRLEKWSEALRDQKRDLLQSNAEGNRAYEIDHEEYEAAFAAATAEKQVLTRGSGK